jgi:ATP-binding cassette, subfamily C (CFTR/MRP), member 4
VCDRFGLRLDLLCLVLLALTAFISGALRASIPVGTIGLALAYVMQLAGLFQWCTRQSVEVENLSKATLRASIYVCV